MSGELVWELTKNNSSFLVKRDGVAFSRERGNLTALNSRRFSGLANSKVVDISPIAGGVVVSTKSTAPADARRPATAFSKTTLNKLDTKRDFRRVAKIVHSQTLKRNYRGDLATTALARWTQLHRAALRASAVKKAKTVRAKRAKKNAIKAAI